MKKKKSNKCQKMFGHLDRTDLIIQTARDPRWAYTQNITDNPVNCDDRMKLMSLPTFIFIPFVCIHFTYIMCCMCV